MTMEETMNSLESNKDGLPKQAGERGPDLAVVDLVRDGPNERESGAMENEVATRPVPVGPPVDASLAEPGLQQREPIDRRDDMAPNAATVVSEPTDGLVAEKVVDSVVPEGEAAIDAVPNGAVTEPDDRDEKLRDTKGVTESFDAGITAASSTNDSPAISSSDAVEESQSETEPEVRQEMDAPAADSTHGSSDSGDTVVVPGLAIVPQLGRQDLAALLDEAAGELVAREDFPHEIDDRAFEHEWLGTHNDVSREAIREELLRKGKYTAHVDDAGNLLSDPDEYRLAVEIGVRIILCVHRERTKDQKREFILRSQTGKRMLTYEQQRELKNSLMLVRLLLGVDFETIAKTFAVCANTVRNVEKRAAADSNSKLGNTKRPDRRYKPATLEKIAEAGRLRAEGMGDADIAAKFDTDVETVGKWLKDPPAGSKKNAKDESGKKPKTGRGTAPAQPQPIEDLAASDDMPELHRWAVERLGWFPEDYAQLEGECRADAEEAVTKVSTVDGELLSHSIYGRHLIAFAEKVLEQRHRSVAAEDRGDEAPPDAGGVIAEGDTDIARLALSEDGEEARVRVNGFDSETGPADRESMPQDNRTKKLEPDVDDRCSPYEKHFGCKEGDK